MEAGISISILLENAIQVQIILKKICFYSKMPCLHERFFVSNFWNVWTGPLKWIYWICRIHVRRTDKVGTEAAYHGIDEYMKYVEEFYNTYQLTNPVDQRRVFIATDDPTVLPEAQRK